MSSEDGEVLELLVHDLRPGAHDVEVMRGALLSEARPFLVLEEGEAVEEVNTLMDRPGGESWICSYTPMSFFVFSRATRLTGRAFLTRPS